MMTNKFGEIALDESDFCNMLMKGQKVWNLSQVTVVPAVEIEKLISAIDDPGAMLTWTFVADDNKSVPVFDYEHQENWFMPGEYRQMDIAEYVLKLCNTPEQLQRVGQELLMYQERNLFDLLRYLKYLVDVMRANKVIWGVGRGSSVASYVLFLLGVHRIDSIFYDLDPGEFLR